MGGSSEKGLPIAVSIYTPAEVLALALRPAVIAVMVVLFATLPEVLGRRRGYLAAYAFYWAVCGLVVPLAFLGPERLLGITAPKPLPGGTAGVALALLLAAPPLAAALGPAGPRLADATPAILAASAALALVNGVTEELLWRALPVAMFPGSVGLAVVFPALGFGVWRLAPLIVLPARGRGGAAASVAGGVALGLCYGAVTYVTGSVLPAIASHVLADLLGLGGFAYLPDRSGAPPPL